MDAPLTDYRSHIYKGRESAKAPNDISAGTSEVGTFIETGTRPVGVMLYRIGNTGSTLHLYFSSWTDERSFAAALLPNSASINSLVSQQACKGLDHTGSIESFQCNKNVPFDTSRSIIIHSGNIFVKVTFQPKETTSILTTEIFEMYV